MNTTPTTVTERKRYLDAAKGCGILMVVFGHITTIRNPVDIWFGAFKLVIFYIVSGYLLAMRQSFRKTSPGQYIWKHAKSLLIPYFGYSAIVMLYNMGVVLVKGKPFSELVDKMLYQGYSTLSLRGISALWFLPSLFIAQVIFIFVMKSPKWVKALSAVVPIVTTAYSIQLLNYLKDNFSSRDYKLFSFPLLTVSKGILGFWFVGAGYVCYLVFKKLQQRELRFLIGLAMTVATIFLSQKNPGVDINMLGVGKYPILMYVNGIMGSMGVILVLEYLEKWWKMTFLNFCGKNSLIIMATHGTLGFKSLMINGWRAMYGLSKVEGTRYILECTGILCELMLLECGVISIVNNYFPWLTGKFGPRKGKGEK